MGGDLDGIESSGPVHAEALARVPAVVPVEGAGGGEVDPFDKHDRCTPRVQRRRDVPMSREEGEVQGHSGLDCRPEDVGGLRRRPEWELV